MKQIGFIGTGGMGSGMAANLLKAGFGVVVNDVRREVTRPLEENGAVFKGSPREVAEASDVVLSMLPYGAAVRQVALGEGGLSEAAGGARTWVDFSSIDKKTVLDVNGTLGERGWALLDASVSGVEEAAAAATLSIWASGPRPLYDENLAVFQAMGKKVVYMGELGNAKLVKTANAMFSGIMHMGMVEVYNWLKAGGLNEEDFENFIRSSQNYSDALERVTRIIVSGEFKPRKSWMPKDVGFGLDVAREMEIPVPFSSLVYQMFAIAQANGVDGYEATGIACEVFSILCGRKEAR
ncbi:MAG: NAD(P)-dependent oxidoreductase [Deltaproteobacteria bacterium]|nr:NAD(P)-dependent oxidoreductase [Deltaproteobacteria bacterium]